MRATLLHFVIGVFFDLENDWQIFSFTREYTARLAEINWDFIRYTICIQQKSCLYTPGLLWCLWAKILQEQKCIPNTKEWTLFENSCSMTGTCICWFGKESNSRLCKLGKIIIQRPATLRDPEGVINIVQKYKWFAVTGVEKSWLLECSHAKIISAVKSWKNIYRDAVKEKNILQNVILFFMKLLENYHYDRAPHCEQQRSADRLATSRPLLFISLTWILHC